MDAPARDDDTLLPLSALQHLVYCERQCALIHLEGVWAENRFTVEGNRLHRRVHDRPQAESRGGVRIARHVRLRSLRLGLSGVADVVEFHPIADTPLPGVRPTMPDLTTGLPTGLLPRADGAPNLPTTTLDTGAALPSVPGRWRPFPVEYKRGRPKRGRCDEIQLCAQALCLEEMLGTAVPAGALFYGRTRRRLDVPFDPALRQATEEAAAALHRLFDSRATPPADRGPKCRNCSLKDVCLPKVAGCGRSAAAFLDRAIAHALTDAPEAEASP